MRKCPSQSWCADEMDKTSRRQFLKMVGAGMSGVGLGLSGLDAAAQVLGERPTQADGIQVINPRGRVPLSFIIDDSTCLVNLNRFAIPQFAQAWKYQRYHHDWRSMPHEIPDDFVRKFGQWCGEREIKGKYSVVPYPACVGRLDRVLPGWTSKELAASLELVRTLMLPNWDIHPEMVTHTIAVDTRTGHPYANPGLEQMENWRFTDGKSVEELTEYFSYALQILKNVGLPCEGITTPGGFGSRVLPELSQASFHSVRNIFGAEIPHYFKHVIASGDQSVSPRVEYAKGIDGPDPQCVVSLVACTGDWTGGWDCSNRGFLDRFITADLAHGRMVEVIDRAEPAIMLCHWTGIYFNGEEVGLKIFQEAVRRMHGKYDHLLWMKLSEIARYWAAKELTQIGRADDETYRFRAPYACPAFTVKVTTSGNAVPTLRAGKARQPLREVARRVDLVAGTWYRTTEGKTVCFDLPKGRSELAG